jgi:GT2 family glycosyltransferase
MRICVLTPSYSGNVNVHFMISLMATITRVKQSECTFFSNIGCSILPQARNSLVARALAWGADKIVMIDDDVSWRPEDFQKLILAPERIVAGVYQKKPHDLEAAKSPEMALSVFPEGLKVDHRGLAEVDGAATGFLRVDREVFEGLKVHCMQLADDSLDPASLEHMYEYFTFDRIIKDGKTYLQGEDYGFCRKARAAGFRTFIDPSIKLGHHMGGFKFGASIEPTHLL